MTTQSEKIRKLRALAKSPNRHETAAALAKAKALENRTAKAIAQAIGQLLETYGLTVRVRRRHGRKRSEADADVEYFCSRARRSDHQLEILITEYQPINERI